MQSLKFWSSFAVAVPAAIRIRRSAVRADGAGGAKSGSVGEGPVLRLVGIGDSIIAGVGASTHAVGLIGRTAEALAATERQRVDWSVCGHSGATSSSIRIGLVPRAALDGADAVVVSAGVNDLTRLRSPARFATELARLLDAIERCAPRARVAVSGMPPLEHFPALPPPLQRAFGIRARQFDAVIGDITASRQRTVHVPIHVDDETVAQRDAFSADGFHPSESSYLPFGRAVAEALIGLTERRSL